MKAKYSPLIKRNFQLRNELFARLGEADPREKE